MFRRYVEMLLKLDAVQRNHGNDSWPAGAIRDRMKGVWWKLSDLERDAASLLSEVLHGEAQEACSGSLAKCPDRR